MCTKRSFEARAGSGERVFASGGHVPREAADGGGAWVVKLGLSLQQVEESLVRHAMRLADANQTRAARLLGISRDALRYRLKKFGISEGPERTRMLPGWAGETGRPR